MKINETIIKHKFQVGQSVSVVGGIYDGEEGKITDINANWGRDIRGNYKHISYVVNIYGHGSPFLSCQERELIEVGMKTQEMEKEK